MSELKDVLKYLRKREGISQAELALRLGVTPSTIGNYESGTRRPTYEIEEALADYFNVSVDFLRGNDTERNSVNDAEYALVVAFRKSDDLTQEMVRRLLGVENKKELTDLA